MVRTVVSWKGYTVALLVLALFFASPFILAAFPQTAAFAPPLFWAGDKIVQGMVVLCFICAIGFLNWLVSDFRRWLARTTAAPAPTLTDLESGTAAAPDLIVLDAEAAESAATTPPPSAPAGPTTTRKVVVLASNFWTVVYYFLTHDIVSVKKPLLENIGATLLFVLRGLEVLFVALLLLGFVAWLVKPKPASPSGEAAMAVPAAPAPPVEVLVVVEETVVEDVPASKEKEYMEAEKA